MFISAQRPPDPAKPPRESFVCLNSHLDIPFDFTGMAEKARNMLRRALDALVNQDEGLAYQVIAADDEVDQVNREMYGQVKDGIRKHPEDLESLIHLLSISRHVERIADLASHIAEEVIYYVKGDIIRHKVGGERLDLPSHAEATKAIAERTTIEDASRRLRALTQLEKHLHTNVNENLALEVCFVQAFG